MSLSIGSNAHLTKFNVLLRFYLKLTKEDLLLHVYTNSYENIIICSTTPTPVDKLKKTGIPLQFTKKGSSYRTYKNSNLH